MTKKKKNLIFNGIMGFAILAIVFAAVMLIGNTRGWFTAKGRIISDGVLGNATITRHNIAYTLENGVGLQNGDEIETGAGDTAAVVVDGDKNVRLNENTSVTLNAGAKDIEMILENGEVFCNLSGTQELKLTGGKGTVSAAGAAFSVTDESDVLTVNVFDGSVEVVYGNDTQTVNGGEYVSALTSSEGKDEVNINALSAESLNEFTINQAASAGESRTMCFAPQALRDVLTKRAEEAAKAKAEADAALAALLAQGGNQAVTTSKMEVKTGEDGKPLPVYTCTLTIRCDTILNNMGDLTPGKDKFVPNNGVILGTSTLQFYEGETVFNVLKRAVDAAGIQMEYSWTPMYGSYYIEGINNLYEFDCGSQSGWMYKVNGWFPNYGCSSYNLKAGDVIVWCYTCKGLGKDVGCGWMS